MLQMVTSWFHMLRDFFSLPRFVPVVVFGGLLSLGERVGAASESVRGEQRAAATPEEVFGIFRKAAEDRYRSIILNQVGAVSLYLSGKPQNEFSRSAASMKPEDQRRLEDLLMEGTQDAVSVRIAVALAYRRNATEGRDLLRKALKKFPEDPELLLGSIAVNDVPGKEIPAIFIKALSKITALAAAGEDGGWHWCGIFDAVPFPARTSGGGWQSEAEAAAVCALVRRLKPTAIPQEWLTRVLDTLSQPSVVPDLKELSERTAMVTKYLKPGSEAGLRQYPGLAKLADHGYTEQAVMEARRVLLQPFGLLPEWVPPHATDGRVCRSPWHSAKGKRPDSPGWTLVKLASEAAPQSFAGVAYRASAATPSDEHLAFTALLARSFVNRLEDGDMAVLKGLSEDGSNRVMLAASHNIPPTRLPVRFCVRAWEYEAVRRIKFNYDEKYGPQPLDYLVRLEEASAVEQTHRVLREFSKAVRPPLPAVVSRMKRRLSVAEWDDWQARMIYANLAEIEPLHRVSLVHRRWIDLLRACSEIYATSGVPEPQRQQISAWLSEVVERAAKEESIPSGDALDLPYSLLWEAAAYPEFAEMVLRRELFRHVPRRSGEQARPTSPLEAHAGLVSRGHLVPEPAVEVDPDGPGRYRLRFFLKGLQLPEDLRYYQFAFLPLSGVAEKVAADFDVVVYSATEVGAPRAEVGKVAGLRKGAELGLKGLPEQGFLELEMIHRGSGTKMGHPIKIPYGSGKVLGDTSLPIAPEGVHPESMWKLLSNPAPLESAGAWLVTPMGGGQLNGVSLLLLDENGRVCGSHPLKAGGRGLLPEDFMPLVVSFGQLGADELPAPSWREKKIRIGSGPRYVALAAATGTVNSHFGRPADLPRIIVRKWADGKKGGLEVLKAWQADESRSKWFLGSGQGLWFRIVIGGEPLQCAWWRNDGTILIAAMEAGDSSEVRSCRLPPGSGPVSGAWWQGALLRFRTIGYDVEGRSGTATYGFVTINTSKVGLEPEHEFLPGDFGFSVNPFGDPAKLGMAMISHYPLSVRILMPDGSSLVPPPAMARELEGCYNTIWAGPTKIGCVITGTSGERPQKVLDWSDGTLRLLPIDSLPASIPIIASTPKCLFRQDPDDEYDFSNEARQWLKDWRMPMPFSEVWQTKEGFFVGISGADLLLMRAVPDVLVDGK